jgi:hypothetical protein
VACRRSTAAPPPPLLFPKTRLVFDTGFSDLSGVAPAEHAAMLLHRPLGFAVTVLYVPSFSMLMMTMMMPGQ